MYKKCRKEARLIAVGSWNVWLRAGHGDDTRVTANGFKHATSTDERDGESKVMGLSAFHASRWFLKLV
jgi:hypothetical protein